MQAPKIIALVGMPGAGKGTCTKYLAETYRYPVVHFGNMVYEEVQRRGLDNIKDEKFVRQDMRAQEGKDVLAKHAGRKAEAYFAEGQAVVVFDGLYSWSEYKYLEQKFGAQLVVIAVAAPKQERYRRILLRKDSHRTYTSVQQIITREIDEIENLEKGGPIAAADYTLVNDQNPDTLLKHLKQLLDTLHTA